MMTRKTVGQSVGQTNGKIAWLFRVNQFLHPYLVVVATVSVAAMGWVVSSVMANNTHRDNAAQICKDIDEIRSQLGEIPPGDFLKERLKSLEKLNVCHSEDFMELKIMLHEVQTDMNSIKERLNISTPQRAGSQ